MRNGDQVMVCTGDALGKVNVNNRTTCFSQQINSVTPYIEGIHRFLLLALRETAFQKPARIKADTGKLPIIIKGKWDIVSVPFPPVAEQEHIVAKVDELMTLCDELEASVTVADDARRSLLAALLAEALSSVTQDAQATCA